MTAEQLFPIEDLSQRETELLSAMASGLSRKDIASEMRISTSTYDGYRKSIRQKLRIKSQVDWGHVLIQLIDEKKIEDKRQNENDRTGT